MQTLYFKEKGEAEKVLNLGENNIADLLPNEIRVKVLASPLNPADFMFIEKKYRLEPKFPQIAGFEGSGLVVENGGDHKFAINSIVAFRHKNVWAEFANIPKDKIILLPKDSSIEKASQLSLNPLTAWALLELLNVRENEWIILSAGSSSVSKLIIQFAKNKNIKTVPIIRDFQQKEELLNLGATLVLDSLDDQIEEKIKEVAKKGRISGFLDAVGGDLISKIVRSISPNSRIFHYGLYSKSNVTYHSSNIIFKNLTIQSFGIDSWLTNKSKTEMDIIWTNIIQEVMNSDFKMDISGKYSFKDYQKAILKSKNSKKGKTLFWMA